MGISSDEFLESTTHRLISHGHFFPSRITVGHRQLRRVVSVTTAHRVYYVSHFDVFVLDLETDRTTLLATIPFEPVCLAAGVGWIGVGGDNKGNCAFIKLDSEDGPPTCFGHDLQVVVLGGLIVNSMSIHALRKHPESEPEPIVLISNNDRSVKIFSLARQKLLTSLEFQVPMNYATLSPDSSLIAAVGDYDKVWFYQRQNLEPGPVGAAAEHAEYSWQLFAEPRIPAGDDVEGDYGFAVTFSPSGHLCAASSQGGSISVFDMGLFTARPDDAEEAILCTFRSSRPDLWGCVRSMAFSPQPWDLLAWAEDHGRVGVVDVRQMATRRQIVTLDKTQSTKVTVEDLTPAEYKDLSVKERLKQQHLARRRELRREGGNHAGHDPIAGEDGSSNQQSSTRDELMAHYTELGLGPRERSVRAALETAMDDVENHQSPPYSVNYTSLPRFRSSIMTEGDESGDLDIRLLASPELRSAYRSFHPRRRTSVVLSQTTRNRHLMPLDSPRARISASPGRMTDDDEDVPAMSTNDLTPSRGGYTSQPRTSDIPSPPQQRFASSSSEAQTIYSRTTLATVESALEAERNLENELLRQLDDERLSRRLGIPGGRQSVHDLEEELRCTTERAHRLVLERERLMSRTEAQQEPTSAQTSALPTFSTLSNRSQSDLGRIGNRALTGLRRQASASPGEPSRGDSSITRSTIAQLRLVEGLARPPTRARVPVPAVRSPAAESSNAAPARTADGAPSGQRNPSFDLDKAVRIASMLFSRGTMGTDANGNWQAGGMVARRRLGGSSGTEIPGSVAESVRGMGLNPEDTEEVLRVIGVGTAGITWSHDGRSL
jgi:hypothetical protein